MKQKLFLILFVFAALASCKQKATNVWTTEYEKKAYDQIYSSLGDVFKNDVQRTQLTHYLIKRFKEQLPDGLESIPTDSLRKLSYTISEEYTYKKRSALTIAWSAQNEASLKVGMEKGLINKMPDKKVRDAFCDCVIVQLKKIRSDSLVTPIPDSLTLRLAGICRSK
jgi:hypothetical protein